MAKLLKVEMFAVNEQEMLTHPIITTFYSPVKMAQCRVTVKSVSETSHWVEFAVKRGRKWEISQVNWNSLQDAIDDAQNDVRLWATEVYRVR